MKSKEHREKLSKAQTKRFEDPTELAKWRSTLDRPEMKEKMKELLKKRFEDPKEHAKLSEAQKKRYEDPEERRKLGEAIRRGWMKRKQVGGDHGPTR